jgi:quinol monooxygenase YgiN
MREKEEVMAAKDTWCMVGAYFKVKPGKLEAFERLTEQFVETTSNEPRMLYYGWSFNGDEAHCRQGYHTAEGLLEHVANVTPLLQEASKIADFTKLTIQGPEEELAKLRGPLGSLNPQFYILKYSFRR